jgi:hypothetical protein
MLLLLPLCCCGFCFCLLGRLKSILIIFPSDSKC